MAYVISIQTVAITIGTGATSNTATISSVNTSFAAVIFGGVNSSDTGAVANISLARVELTNATTVTATRNTSSGSFTVTVYATIIEFDSSMISSVQAGTISFTTAQTTNTATISSVTTSRAVVLFLGAINSSGSLTPTSTIHALTLTNATTVTADRGTASAVTMTMGYMVVEFQAAVIQSVQARSVTLATSATSNTDTITSVTTGNTMLLWNGGVHASTAVASTYHNITLTNSTTVTLTRTGSSTSSRTIKYTVLEFVSGVLNSAQRGTVAFGATSSKDTTISSVNTSYAVANWLGSLASASATTAGEILTSAKLFDATTIRTQRGAATNDATVSWEAIEFTSVTGIAFDAASNSAYQAAASSYSWSHTCTGSNRYLVVGIAMLSLAQTVTSITYNSVPLTLLGIQASITGAARVELWGLVAPSTGSNTIAVTLSGAIASAGCAASYTGVHQTSPTEAFNSAQATNVGAADATVNVTTVADNDWCVDIVATDDTAITVGTGNTSRNNVTGIGGSGAMGDTNSAKTPAGSVTMSWTNVGAAQTWAIGGVALRPIAAASLSVYGFMAFF